jgi:FkbM family methyltransferase
MCGQLHHLRENGFEPQAVIDIGANVGDWSRAAAAVFQSSQFFMVDGNPDNEGRLRAAQRDIPNSQYAVHLLGPERRDGVPFYSMGSGSSVLPEFTSFERRTIQLRMTTLDELLKEVRISPPALMKLDVQGYELEILRGGNQALQRCEVVIAETTLIPFNEGAPLFAEVVKFMDEAGFVVYDFCGQARRSSDHALFQADVIFVRNTSDLRKPRQFLHHQPDPRRA